MQAFSSGERMFCSRKRMMKLEKRWWLQQYEHKQASFARPKYACTAGYSHKYDIPLPPAPPSPPLCWPGLKIWKGGVHAVKITNTNSSERYAFWAIEGEKLTQFGYFFMEGNRICLSQRFWPPTSYVAAWP